MMLGLLGLILLGPAAGAAIAAYFARRYGFKQGYQLAFAQQEIAADDLRDEITHLEQWTAALSVELAEQQRRAA